MESCHAAPNPATAPTARCRAVIDVGTNSVKLLVAEVLPDGDVTPIVERGEQTRLGEGFFDTRMLRPEAIRRTAEAAAAFRTEADRFGASRIRLIATAAAREALNRDDLLSALRQATGLDPEVISGDTEAALAFRGVCTTASLAHAPLLVTDLGGGSTEFIVGRSGIRRFSQSFPLGAVRLMDRLSIPSHPAAHDLTRCRSEVDAFLGANVVPRVAPALAAASTEAGTPARYVGVGGTAVILARIASGLPGYDRARIEATSLDVPTVTRIVEHLWSLPLETRRSVPGLPPERADIILPGAVVYERILRTLRLDGLSVSTRGLRFAALLDPDPVSQP